MASLSASGRLGNASTSSLLRSSASLQNEINTYNDSVEAYKYELSAKTDGDLQNYQAYLNKRMGSLNATGTPTDASKALALSRTLTSATRANISTTILRENIQVMAGNASPQDKLNLITNQFQRAIGNGDMATAQSLESQAYSLSQTIQQQAAEAAKAAATLASSSASSAASAQNAVAGNIENNFKQLNSDAAAGGMGALNKALKTWVTNNKTSLLALAKDPSIDPSAKAAIEKAVNTSQPNYVDIASGVGAAMVAAHYLAYKAELPINPQTAQGYLDAATNLANGNSTLKTLAGGRTLDELATWQQNPAMFIPRENVNTGKLEFTFGDGSKIGGTAAITGFKYDGQGNVIASYSGQTNLDPLTDKQATQINDTLKKVGLSYTKVKAGDTLNNGVDVQFTNKAPKYLQPVAGSLQNVVAKAYVTPQGVQVASIDDNGKNHIYLLATDDKGLHAVYQSTGQFNNGNPIFGKQVAAGDYGFNQNSNSLWKGPVTSGSTTLSTHMYSGGPNITIDNANRNSFTGASGNHIFALNNLISGAQNQFYQIQQQRIAADQALAAQQAAQAHAAQFGATSIPNPHAQPIPVAAPASPMPRTVNPQPMTYNPQPKTVNPQGGAGQQQTNVTGVPLNANPSGPKVQFKL